MDFFSTKKTAEPFRSAVREAPSARNCVPSKFVTLMNIFYNVLEYRIYLLLWIRINYIFINLRIGTLIARIITAFTSHTSICFGIRSANTASKVRPIPLK